MSGKPAYFHCLHTVLLGSRNRKLLFADSIGCTIGRVFARTCNWDLARARKRTNLG